jgi:hypothetical protein
MPIYRIIITTTSDPTSNIWQNFYMIGRDKNRALCRVLKIDRLEPSELVVLEDSTTYSESECVDLLRRIHEGNKSTGGLKFVTICYGIVGMLYLQGLLYELLIYFIIELMVLFSLT